MPRSCWSLLGLAQVPCFPPTRLSCVQVGDTEEDEVAGAAGLGVHGCGQVMHMDDEHDEHHGLDEASLKEHEEVTKVKVRAGSEGVVLSGVSGALTGQGG